jgi:hypothetical protein
MYIKFIQICHTAYFSVKLCCGATSFLGGPASGKYFNTAASPTLLHGNIDDNVKPIKNTIRLKKLYLLVLNDLNCGHGKGFTYTIE